MKFPIFRYELNEQLPVSDIFNSNLFGEKHDVSIYILLPALRNYQTKYPYDLNIGNILQENNYRKKLEYPVTQKIIHNYKLMRLTKLQISTFQKIPS